MKSKSKSYSDDVSKDENANSNDNQDVALASGRFLSTRDLLKWVKRVHILYQNSIGYANARENIFYEAVDCFCGISVMKLCNNQGMIPKPDLRKNLIQAIGSSWSISPERVHQYLTLHKPGVQRTNSTFSVGRVTIPRDSMQVDKVSENLIYVVGEQLYDETVLIFALMI